VTSAFNLDQFRTAFRSGGLRSVQIRAVGGQFFVTAKPQNGRRITLAVTHGKRHRAFRNPAKAIEVLHRIGAHRIEVDTAEWSPVQARLAAPKRPDTAARQRRAHEAARHDEWFRQEVEESLREAGRPRAGWDSQAAVERISVKKRLEWLEGSSSAKKAKA
jgi:hypothetical protein